MKREPAVRAALSKMYRSGKNIGVLHDMKCTGAMHPLSSDVIKVGVLSPSFDRHRPSVQGMFQNVCRHNFKFLTRLRPYLIRGAMGLV